MAGAHAGLSCKNESTNSFNAVYATPFVFVVRLLKIVKTRKQAGYTVENVYGVGPGGTSAVLSAGGSRVDPEKVFVRAKKEILDKGYTGKDAASQSVLGKPKIEIVTATDADECFIFVK